MRELLVGLVMTVTLIAAPSYADSLALETRIIRDWYRLVLELVRHTPTYSPPVASRALAYTGVIVYEAGASGRTDAVTLAGQLNGLAQLPQREAGADYDEAVILNTALSRAVEVFFANTGPTGQRAAAAIERSLAERSMEGLDAATVARSEAYGRAVADHVVEWSYSDGGAEIVNMGFPPDYQVSAEPGRWVPTSRIAQQQVPLLPHWGKVRTFALPSGATCDLPPPPAFSMAAGTAFYHEAKEVYEVVEALSEEQRAIARFWSDDPMLSPTPPGHWISIGLQVLEREGADPTTYGDALARLGIAVADAFIGCWQTKFKYDLVRPVTYIREVFDPGWEPPLLTPPFPEYPSGHSTLSGAAAAVLKQIFGEDYAFVDATHEADGIPARAYVSFEDAAEEAAISRLYGGIHFRAAVERGLDQGRCIGAYAARLETLK